MLNFGNNHVSFNRINLVTYVVSSLLNCNVKKKYIQNDFESYINGANNFLGWNIKPNINSTIYASSTILNILETLCKF